MNVRRLHITGGRAREKPAGAAAEPAPGSGGLRLAVCDLHNLALELQAKDAEAGRLRRTEGAAAAAV
ncbi:MAG TPA: hypothetical protein VFS30_15850 [Dehalococcoidia bacterium]|nr:hypothetical protein [Dehalococcoidia bacterium]